MYLCAWLQNALLEFVRVVEAKEQVVAGTLHHLTLEAIEAGKKKLYEAKVWVKPWLDFKELQDFSHKGEATTFTNADLGAKKGSRSRLCNETLLLLLRPPAQLYSEYKGRGLSGLCKMFVEMH
jgi:hypothetical protein